MSRALACIAVVVLIPVTAVTSQSFEAARSDVSPIAGLKLIYLDCERMAANGDLDTSEIMKCSMIYEELKRRAFDGSFRLLKAWADTKVPAEGS
jgi:hypothetical protein